MLIRSVEDASGPGRVTKAMGITCADNRLALTPENGIWIEDDGTPVPPHRCLARVGIDYAAKADRDRPWRYLVV